MLDFITPMTVQKNNTAKVIPMLKCCESKDLMIRGGDFYAIWDEDRNRWSTDEFDLIRLVDSELWKYRDDNMPMAPVETISDFTSKQWLSLRQYMKSLPDNYHQLDNIVAFKDTIYSKEDYVSKSLLYSLSDSEPTAYNKIMSVLYNEEERAKIEWAIGSIFAGEGKDIQKFIVLYGSAGAGKSTVLNIIQMLFDGYYSMFEAKELASSSNQFATEAFRGNPLVAIQHDGDLSKIEDNTRLNSIVSHEEMVMHEKYKSSYISRANCFIFMATNKPVKITDAKSGLIRRLIDVRPSGRKIPSVEYYALMDQVRFELGSIANRCLNLYKSMGRNYYDLYIPVDMMFKTDAFFNFVEQSYFVFKEQPSVSLKQAYDMYKEYCTDSGLGYLMPRYKFRDELMNYFDHFEKVGVKDDGTRARSLYYGFKSDIFNYEDEYVKDGESRKLELNCTISLLDSVLADCPAQYATEDGKPKTKWDFISTTLSELDTKRCHYVKVPSNHIVIDFDLRDDAGEKSLQKCLSEATKWPLTYAEVSQGGNGLHLHYIWQGDPESLRRVYSENIEIKVFTGNSSLRRKLTRCNDIQIATISSGLPLKEEKVVNFEAVKSEKSLRNLIERNLRKEIHPGTKPSIDFIFKILDDAYNSGLKYDISDMRQRILKFAMHSKHHAEYCIHKVKDMKFKSEEPSENVDSNEEIIFYDVEVFPNLFLVNWKRQNDDQCIRMINPSAQDIEVLLKKRLVGFNCRRYDNHILYARYIGYTIEELYSLSQKIVNGSRGCMFGEAYNISYADVYDFCSTKQSLKKWEIELGIHHQELGLPWDKPVPEEKWIEVAEYCDNDVKATEAVFYARQEDFIARKILAELAGGCPNDTTQTLAGKFIFGDDPKPQEKFVYTDLSEMFPGYIFDGGHSVYRGEDPGEGGYVYAEPGMYFNVALLDVASMHPTSIECLDLFGPYTKRYSELKTARVYIKHGDREAASNLLNGVLRPYLENDIYSLDALSYALKILINSIYGFTSAKFDNKFKDPRNKDNIVAKRGALFMIDLKNAVQEKGFTVAHIKTDSIKIPNATQEIIDFIFEFGKKYGYTFEHEATYSQMCLVNDAVYIAKYKDGDWTATGTQFKQPYVFKTLFSKEPICFGDMCETKTVTTAIYLDFNEDLPNGEHNYKFVGKAGQFTPVKPGCGGGELFREKEGKYYAVTGTKGYRWMESEVLRILGREDDVDKSYYDRLVDEALEDISKFGDFEVFYNYEECEIPF